MTVSLRIFLVKIKFPKYAYSVLSDTCIPEKQINFWSELLDDSGSGPDFDLEDWETIHLNNFKCTIDTRLRSFYFKLFHRAIAFNNFLFKINRKDSPNCSFCDKFPEASVHIFCDCEIDPFGVISFKLLLTNMILILHVQNLIKFLAFPVINFSPIYF